MNIPKLRAWLWLAALSLAGPAAAQSPVYINEICFNPPNQDTPHEYIELRGLPSYVLPVGTYFVAVDGDFSASTNPGLIQNVFDLSGRQFGTNGLMVLLQKNHLYSVNPRATAVVNTGSGPGWGSGATSSIGHQGEGGKTELDNASVTFFLLRSSFAPEPDEDIDGNNDGVPDGPYLNWTVHDSVGLLDATGPGDFSYGAISYRRDTPPGSGAIASGVIVSVGFTPVYAGRMGNSIGSIAVDWVSCNNLANLTPPWNLPDPNNTSPSSMASQSLNHIGGPNWGGQALRGLSIHHTGGRTEVSEGAGNDTYSIALNNPPTGNVVVQVDAPPPLQISVDGGANFFTSRTLSFNSITPQNVVVRALDDNLIDMSPFTRNITHAIVSTADANFPETLPLAPAPVQVLENDWLLLSEIKANPPGEDAPFEFVELRGPPGALITNVQFVALDGDADGDPGEVDCVVNLTSQRLGANGLLLLVGPGNGYGASPSTTVITVPVMGTAGGVLGNGSTSFLLIGARGNIAPGVDLDGGDNGVAEGLPVGAIILDAVGWRDNSDDFVYGDVVLVDAGDIPDAAARFLDNNTPRSAAAWYFGDLDDADGRSLAFDEEDVSPNFPYGTPLTPGYTNNTAPQITTLEPMSGAIGDPTNPKVFFTVSDFETPAGSLVVTATSTNPAVVPDANLTLTTIGNGQYTLALEPLGIGYSFINLSVSDGATTRRVSFRYAASERCSATTRFHFWASDSSTAIPIDANYMFIGDDENQIIRIYRRNESGPPLVGFDFTPFLGLTDIENGRPREVDIEGSTQVGNRIFWIGAHSHANIAEGRTNRSRVFGTDWTGSGLGSTLSYVGRYDYLKIDLVNWDMSNGHGKGANYYGLAASTMDGVNPKEADGSGFNIEGLTMAPGSSTVGYVAFRAPIVPATNRTHALIVPVLNFSTVAVGNLPEGSAVFGAPIELDLYGRGIRSIERVGNEYLIVAGIPGDFPDQYPNDFRLYTWTGNPADRPQERATDLRGLNPEGIVELPPAPWTASSIVHLLTDSGRKVWYGDNITAKEMRVPNFKKFRTDPLPLGNIVKTSPKVTHMRYGPGGFTIGWRSIQGERYRVQYKSAFSDADWTPLPGDILADSTHSFKTDPAPLGTHRFYHVLVLP